MSAAHENTVRSHLEAFQEVLERDRRGTHNPNGPHIGRVLKATDPRQIRTGVSAPVTKKSKNVGFKFRHVLSFCVSIFSQTNSSARNYGPSYRSSWSVGVVEHWSIGKTSKKEYSLIDALLHHSSTPLLRKSTDKNLPSDGWTRATLKKVYTYYPFIDATICALICFRSKPARRALPEGQAAAQDPQPLQRAMFTWQMCCSSR